MRMTLFVEIIVILATFILSFTFYTSMRFTKILNFREISCKLKFFKNFKNQDNWCLLQPYLLQLFLCLPLGCLPLKILH